MTTIRARRARFQCLADRLKRNATVRDAGLFRGMWPHRKRARNGHHLRRWEGFGK